MEQQASQQPLSGAFSVELPYSELIRGTARRDLQPVLATDSISVHSGDNSEDESDSQGDSVAGQSETPTQSTVRGSAPVPAAGLTTGTLDLLSQLASAMAAQASTVQEVLREVRDLSAAVARLEARINSDEFTRRPTFLDQLAASALAPASHVTNVDSPSAATGIGRTRPVSHSGGTLGTAAAALTVAPAVPGVSQPAPGPSVQQQRQQRPSVRQLRREQQPVQPQLQPQPHQRSQPIVKYNSRSEVFASLVLSIVLHVRSLVEARDRQPFQSGVGKQVTRLSRVISELCADNGSGAVVLPDMGSPGMRAVTELFVRRSKYEIRSVNGQTYLTMMLRRDTSDVFRCLVHVINRMRAMYEVLLPPGGDVLYAMNDAIVSETGQFLIDTSVVRVRAPTVDEQAFQELVTDAVPCYVRSRLQGHTPAQSALLAKQVRSQMAMTSRATQARARRMEEQQRQMQTALQGESVSHLCHDSLNTESFAATRFEKLTRGSEATQRQISQYSRREMSCHWRQTSGHSPCTQLCGCRT